MSLRTAFIYFTALTMALSSCTHFSWQKSAESQTSINIPQRWPSSNDQTGEEDEEESEEQNFSVASADEETPGPTPLISRRSTATVEQYTEMNLDNLLEIFETHNVTKLDELPALLPYKFVSNFQLKHGKNEEHVRESGVTAHGPRGHKPEFDIEGMGIHAEPLHPRVYVFDPKTGFAISYNGGKKDDGSPIQGGHTLDIFEYNSNDHSFELHKIDFDGPGNTITPGSARSLLSNESCTSCHGPNNRPIFSMYPDWPRFYGSDNDELLFGVGENNPEAAYPADDLYLRRLRHATQKWEREHFSLFKQGPARTEDRYKPLFVPQAYTFNGFSPVPADPAQRITDALQLRLTPYIYDQYPYRSDVEQGPRLDLSNISRAFTRRAGLRFNLLYSRLLVRHVVHQMTTGANEERFNRFGPFFIYNMMRCGTATTSEPNATNRTAVIDAWRSSLERELRRTAAHLDYKVWSEGGLTDIEHNLMQNGLKLRENGTLLDYQQNLALFGLKINDVDMRFTYYHPDYDPRSEGMNSQLCNSTASCLSKTMDVGYLEGSYFNSYNDGSTTMDEHLTAQLLIELSKKLGYEEMRQILYPNGGNVPNPVLIRGLLDKYQANSPEDTYYYRMRFDREYFGEMDKYSKWFSLPYAESVKEHHHRAPFEQRYRPGYERVCSMLKSKLLTNAPR